MEQCPQLRNRSLVWVCIQNANRTRDFHLGKTFLPSILNTIQFLIFQGEFFVTRLVRSLPQECTGWPQIPLLKTQVSNLLLQRAGFSRYWTTQSIVDKILLRPFCFLYTIHDFDFTSFPRNKQVYHKSPRTSL